MQIFGHSNLKFCSKSEIQDYKNQSAKSINQIFNFIWYFIQFSRLFTVCLHYAQRAAATRSLRESPHGLFRRDPNVANCGEFRVGIQPQWRVADVVQRF